MIKITNEYVQEILDNGFNNFLETKTIPFWPIMFQKLIMSFYKYNIIFYLRKGFIGKKTLKGCYARTIIEKENSLIMIGIERDQLKSLKNKKEIDIIKKQVFGHLLHELIHREQNKRKSQQHINYLYDNFEKYNAEPRDNIYEYIRKDKDEMEAFARLAIHHLEENIKSEIIETYSILDDKEWKRFLKKLYQHSYDNKDTKRKICERLKYIDRNENMA